MEFKDILVHIDTRSTCRSRIETAIGIARQQQARLTGLYVIPHPYFASRHTDQQQIAETARRSFEERTADAGLEAEWICTDCAASGMDMPQLINLHAHYRDLLVVSQVDFEHPDRSSPPDLPERAVLGTGRPVLIVPYAGSFDVVGKHIMLGWRGGPESSRALHDAMPMLQRAESVRVLSVKGRHGDDSDLFHNSDICRHLKRHGIDASRENLTSGDLKTGDLLLSRVADQGIDLLVIGAFAQARRGHQTLGELGRYLLQSMTVPVLMSH